MKIGLLPRMALALGTAGLVPLILTAVPLLRLNREAMTTQVLRTHAVAARATADRLGAYLQGLRRSIDDALAAALEADVPTGGLLRELLASNGALSGISLLDAGGAEVVRAQRRGDAAIVAGFVEDRVPDGVAIRRAGGRSWLVMAWHLKGRGLQVVVVAHAGRMAGLLRPDELGQDAQMALIDRRARELLSGHGDPAAFPAAMRRQAAAGRTSGSGRFHGRGGVRVLGAWAPVPGSSWTIMSLQPALVAEEVAHRAAHRAWAALLVALVLTSGLTGMAYYSLVRPLRRVLALQRQVAGLRGTPLSGGEIEALESSLKTLERRSRDRDEIADIFLGRYRIIEILGEGAMGTVFRAWDPKLRRGVAIKTVRLDEVLPRRREEFVGRLMHEAVAAARFNHPNVVGVYDVVEHEDAAFLAMELVEGVSLQELFRFRKRFLAAEAAQVGRAVARALAAAHASGLVHHDVKPGNILLGFDGSIKVTDFGIARFLNEAVEDTQMIYGTPGYLPPETLQGDGYDELGDVFALGVVLFQMLAGMLPRLTRSLQDTLAGKIRGEAEPVSQYNSDVPEDLDRLIEWALSAERKDRAPSALVVGRQLDAIIREHEWVWEPPKPTSSTTMEVDDATMGVRSRLIPTRLHPGRRQGGRGPSGRPHGGGAL